MPASFSVSDDRLAQKFRKHAARNQYGGQNQHHGGSGQPPTIFSA
jgi:hypothetical protein